MVLSIAAIRFTNRSSVKFFSRWFTALNLLPSIATVLQMQVPAEWAVVAAEIGDRLEVRCKTARQPDQLEIAPALAFEPTRGLDLVEVAS
jgi:hypothetical protein